MLCPCPSWDWLRLPRIIGAGVGFPFRFQIRFAAVVEPGANSMMAPVPQSAGPMDPYIAAAFLLFLVWRLLFWYKSLLVRTRLRQCRLTDEQMQALRIAVVVILHILAVLLLLVGILSLVGTLLAVVLHHNTDAVPVFVRVYPPRVVPAKELSAWQSP